MAWAQEAKHRTHGFDRDFCLARVAELDRDLAELPDDPSPDRTAEG